jgi:hypothetical protein
MAEHRADGLQCTQTSRFLKSARKLRARQECGDIRHFPLDAFERIIQIN